MSNPVTNAEVEDVLSSIRRLVSEDKRPIQIQKAIPANDRLVLTPALRVAEETDVESDLDALEFEEDDLDDLTVEAEQDTAEVSSEQDEETNFDDPAHDYEADPYSFADDEDEDGEGDLELDFSALKIEDEDNDSLIDTPAVAKTGTSDVGSGKAAALSAKIEALETAIGKISDTWEPDEPGSDEYSGTEEPAMAWEDDDDHDHEEMGASLDVEDKDEDEYDDHDHEVDAYHDAGESQAAAMPATPEAQPEPQPELMAAQPSQNDTHEEDRFAYGNDDQVIDEEALRDLVSDIVRAELQGALGERITRNVRKLVRREIHRALTAQELE
ncbi:hypothetical protein [Sulfitobacter sp. MF3-043]|uniref:hypothetical protein n=1 Tax=Sulfitobacter sediminivivens TaxID=3252902 RepID=UPI0036D945C9